jgi:scyllo-inositol 2-dehydrogenase (NADP+)
MNQINVGILSFGMSGRVFHAPFINEHPGFKFYAVLERSKDLAKEKYPGVKTFRKLEDLLADRDVELVVVNTPNYTHFEYAKKALLAGKHVIVEKPFTATVAEGEELIALAKEQNKMLSVYHNRRFDSDYRTVRKIVQEGLLGDIVEAEIHYDRFKGELSPKLHKETPGPGTGALYDLGSHLIDQAIQLFGMPQEMFADIEAMRPVSKVDDYFELILYYPDKRIRLKSSYQVREALPGYIFHGSKGSFIKAKTDIQEAALLEGKRPVLDPDAAEGTAPDYSPGSSGWGIEPESEKGYLHTEKDGHIIKTHIPSLRGNYMDYYNGIYRSLREDRSLPVTAEEGLDVIRIIEAAFLSKQEKRIVPVKPQL